MYLDRFPGTYAVYSVTGMISALANKLTIRLTSNYSQSHLQKLKAHLDAGVGTTRVYLEVPSKADPTKIHRIRTGKSIQVHRALLDYIENTLGSNAWSFE